MSGGATSQSARVFDLSARTKLRISGGDRVRYLNGQITNDIRKATAANAIHAALLNAKGHFDAEIFIRAEGDSFLLDADADLRDSLPLRLERYIIADDVQVEDVTTAFALFHSVGTAMGSIQSQRFGIAGTDMWVAAEQHEQTLAQLRAAASFCDDEETEMFRIERGIPRWGRELTNEIIPTEANLEVTAIDYGKGCYIGQEVISRIKMSGQTNKRLCGIASENDSPLQSGWLLFENENAQRDCGWITSATRSARLGKQIALAFVRRGHNAVGTRLFASDERLPVVVASLPFV